MSSSAEAETKVKPFVVSVSARALFDLEDAHEIFEREGREAFIRHMIENEDKPLSPGPAMGLIRKLLNLNQMLPPEAPHVEVVLISRNGAETAPRLFNSMEHHNVPLLRSVLTDGEPSSKYIRHLKVNLFLSSNPDQVVKALSENIGAATMMPRPAAQDTQNPTQQRRQDQIRIAFDGDAVLFSDESEKEFAAGQLEGFNRFEEQHRNRSLPGGPLRSFLEFLHTVQQFLPAGDESPVRTALVTARGNQGAWRPLRTFKEWGIHVNEAMFMAGADKAAVVAEFGPDLFFDDSKSHIQNAMKYVNAGHVPYGVRNQAGADERNFTGGGQELDAQANGGKPLAGQTDPDRPGADAAEIRTPARRPRPR